MLPEFIYGLTDPMPIENGIYFFHHNPGGDSYPPLVFVHGAAGTHLNWPPELRRFPGKEVYSVDLPGHGKSGGHAEQTLEAYADRVAEWMGALQLFRAFVVGHSMGGGIAMELSIRHPHRTAGIGLVSTGPRLPVPANLLTYSKNPATFSSALEILRELSFGSQAAPRLVELAMQRLSEVRPSVLQNDFQACMQFDITERLEKIRCPAVVICGSEDRLTPLRNSQFLVNRIKKAELRLVPGAGHMVMLENPPQVAAILADTLKTLKRPF